MPRLSLAGRRRPKKLSTLLGLVKKVQLWRNKHFLLLYCAPSDHLNDLQLQCSIIRKGLKVKNQEAKPSKIRGMFLIKLMGILKGNLFNFCEHAFMLIPLKILEHFLGYQQKTDKRHEKALTCIAQNKALCH